MVMGRRRYIKELTTVAVDKEVLEELKKLKLHKGEPLGEVVRRLVKAYRMKEITGY
jgi:hypothetical protein